MSCPDDDTLAALCAGTLAPARRAELELHIDECEVCHALVGALVRDGASPEAEAVVARGRVLDGFVLRSRLGVGAMGDVWLADEPSLGRQVALKFLRPDRTLPNAADLLRAEAQALAKLSHPNVVAVHRVGRAAGRDYLVMERIDGPSLREWVKRRRPSLDARVDALIQAGRGLAAAHGAGVIHRDFKPANVMIGADGRVRVGDFGLARACAPAAVPGELTTATSAAGTPAYMAPELLAGHPATEASDQFAFAASLFEVVYGVRPYRGTTERELAQAQERGRLAVPDKARAPRWLHAVAVRGLASNPAERFASVAALVDALAKGRGRKRRLIVVAAIAGASVLSGVASLALVGPPGPDCDAAGAVAAQVWNPTRDQAVRQRAAHVSRSTATWELARSGIGEYARRWREQRVDTCRATHEQGVQSPLALDQRSFCLERGLEQLDALLARFEAADRPETFARAAEAVTELPAPDRCASEAQAHRIPVPPAAQAVAVEAAFRELDRGRALRLVGRYGEALAVFDNLRSRCEELAFAPLSADLYGQLGAAADGAGEFARAKEALLRAAAESAPLGDVRAVFEHHLRLARMDGFDAQFDAAMARAPLLESLAALSDQPEAVARHHETIGAVHAYRGEYEASLARADRALAALPRASEGTLTEARIRRGRGIAYMRLARYDDAAPELGRSADLYVELLGPEHPQTAKAYINLGNLAWFRGDQQAALDSYQRAMQVQVAAAAGCKADCAITLGNIGLAQYGLGRFEAAVATLDRAVELRRLHHGPDHPEVALALSNKGNALRALGRTTEAVQAIKQALEIRQRSDAPRHDDLIRGHLSLARAFAAGATGAGHRDAIASATRALDLGTEALGADHPLVAWARRVRAESYLALGQVADARADATAAVAVLSERLGERSSEAKEARTILAGAELARSRYRAVVRLLAADVAEPVTVDTAHPVFLVSRARWALGDEAEALTLARSALDVLGRDADGTVGVTAAEVEGWLAQRRRHER